jgi:pimeloyl-ACP methyl ester carboxylesterase
MIRNTILMLSLLLLCRQLAAQASERIIPKEVTTMDFAVKFNGGYTKAQCLFMDLRTDEEIKRDTLAGKLSGPVILFLHGHSQRPGNGYNFTSELCKKSKSGIIIIPVSDTPYGREYKWRGDDGKDVILMEIAKHVLQKNRLSPDSYRPLTDFKVEIRVHNSIPSSTEEGTSPPIPVKLMAVGWSHGGILARRLASRYPELITDLVQITPAGYENWGSNSCLRTGCLMSAFKWESLRIGTGIFRGEGRYVFDAGWGVAKGQAGDTFRSCGSCIYGNFHPLTPFRIFHDTADCAGYLDDTSFPVPHLRNIVVLFGRSDSLFEYRNAGIKNPDNPGAGETGIFGDNYYRSAVQSGSKLTVKVLPGNHIAPLVYSSLYVREALTNTGQLRD